jgi:hypothetical protein
MGRSGTTQQSLSLAAARQGGIGDSWRTNGRSLGYAIFVRCCASNRELGCRQRGSARVVSLGPVAMLAEVLCLS